MHRKLNLNETLNTKVRIQMIEQLHYYQASIELELLLLSSFDVLPLDFLAEISMKSIT